MQEISAEFGDCCPYSLRLAAGGRQKAVVSGSINILGNQKKKRLKKSETFGKIAKKKMQYSRGQDVGCCS